MTEQTTDRRTSQAIFYDAISDRRRDTSAPHSQKLEWPPAEPAIPGTIRKGVMDDWDGVERRRVPEVGME